MKSKFKQLIVLALILFTSFFSYAQRFIEKQLPAPDQLSTFFIGPLLKSTIHYGKTPPNYNGEILLFNHGYIDLNQLFFTNNTFYQDVYNDGYQVVFVATTRGEGMWVNGELLAESIDIITNKYQVNNLNIIAHSNGGKATEAAMFFYNKRDKVKKVIALGTPFWGTYLADVSQQWWFNWIWRNTGLNEGSATSTTYYCRDVVRPYFDNASNNQPEKFIILGASGFKNGHTILAPLMFTSGSILYLAQGTNDGVTPYSSSLRPGASYIFDKGEAKLDHIDVALGQYVWNTIKPYLNTSFARKKVNSTIEISKREIISNYQIINSENSYDQVIANKSITPTLVTIFHEKELNDFKIYNNNSELIPLQHKKTPHEQSKYQSSYTIEKLQNLNANSRFAAFIHYSDGPRMKYATNKENESVSIRFDRTDISLDEIVVNAIITKTGNLYGETIKGDSFVYSFTLDSNAKNFTLDTSDFENGTYSIYVTGKHQTFVRSIASGFTVGQFSLEGLKKQINISKSAPEYTLLTNIIDDQIEISNNSGRQEVSYSIFNLNGQLQLQNKVIFSNQKLIIQEGISSLAKGIYILIVNDNNSKKSFKIVKQ
ncbi:T9SS type A sorting domain-containing protein [Tenacibaculum agarivorans]|uniref:T9SS type A sorting domain-containing protein n=1 Tax=Tenacibaculum agarivorans TaxID=1908389 RepID=UPI00094BC38F|nr:T9SS type A sorting domain-containing protein [Tenacibaculum agarivorans]